MLAFIHFVTYVMFVHTCTYTHIVYTIYIGRYVLNIFILSYKHILYPSIVMDGGNAGQRECRTAGMEDSQPAQKNGRGVERRKKKEYE
jgi:hypothetical protein